MLRFIMKKTFHCEYNNMSGEEFYTIDNDIVTLENLLKSGGHSESSFERHELIGVEIIKD